MSEIISAQCWFPLELPVQPWETFVALAVLLDEADLAEFPFGHLPVASISCPASGVENRDPPHRQVDCEVEGLPGEQDLEWRPGCPSLASGSSSACSSEEPHEDVHRRRRLFQEAEAAPAVHGDVLAEMRARGLL